MLFHVDQSIFLGLFLSDQLSLRLVRTSGELGLILLTLIFEVVDYLDSDSVIQSFCDKIPHVLSPA